MKDMRGISHLNTRHLARKMHHSCSKIPLHSQAQGIGQIQQPRILFLNAPGHGHLPMIKIKHDHDLSVLGDELVQVIVYGLIQTLPNLLVMILTVKGLKQTHV